MFDLPDISEILEDFASEARTTVDSMISRAEHYGIDRDSPWSAKSLRSVGARYLDDEVQFTIEELGAFLGEGMVRERDGRWEVFIAEGQGVLTKNDAPLTRTLRFLVGFENSGSIPTDTIHIMTELKNPEVLVALTGLSDR